MYNNSDRFLIVASEFAKWREEDSHNSFYDSDVGSFIRIRKDAQRATRLYNIAKGTVGVMKMRKPMFRKQPVKPGDVIRLIEWQKKPAYQFIDGKQTVKSGQHDLWMEKYALRKP